MQMVLTFASHCQCGFCASDGKTWPTEIEIMTRVLRELKKWLPD
jgi:hypothetical protein